MDAVFLAGFALALGAVAAFWAGAKKSADELKSDLNSF
jgi:hypothetical protein